MGAWDFVVDLFGPLAVGLVLGALGWAALERGRIHAYLARQRSDSYRTTTAPVADGRLERLLFGVFRFARRARRIQVAVGAVAGWV